ncbi:DUF6602 domain-containing protein [Saccharibacillus alkalitolerans]|uniref:DUF6602 domain-containing protein n=1 Tax=Saccharibacillus alkalitolerans TaxID=2705290 RepID=A0ABX0EZJ2_9BACL|nr:DUF6602 domain-containing protein [Saccharibacillus alkalitolerans]NGZ74056.1 hypothetical protein [Saccharibacillus alkalitolerans]
MTSKKGKLTKSNRGKSKGSVPPEQTIRAIAKNYMGTQHSIINQLTFETPSHHLTSGTTRERIWLKLFESITPKKFCIDQGVFIIDSYGEISAEVDIAIFDESYTPYIFSFENMKFIPIEAVAVAIQCKSGSVSGVNKWASSIKRLKTFYNSYFRVIAGVVDSQKNFKDTFNYLQSSKEKREKIQLRAPYSQSQTSTRPLLILCTSLEGARISASIESSFDIILDVNEGQRLKKTILNEKEDYSWWYKQLNHYGHERYTEEAAMFKALIPEVEDTGRTLKSLAVQTFDENEENVLLSLTFQLNQLLMLINNPMPFPHQAYADMFRENYKKFSNLNTQAEEPKESKK